MLAPTVGCVSERKGMLRLALVIAQSAGLPRGLQKAFKINTAKHVQNNIFVQLSILEPQYPAPHDQGAGPWHAYWFHCFWY